MNRSILLISVLVIISLFTQAQNNMVKQAPRGFDSLRAVIANGKIDTIIYGSKTVGTKVLI